MKLAGDCDLGRDLLALPLATHAGRRVCAPLHPSYGARAYIVSNEGARRSLARSDVIVDTIDVFLFRVPSPTARIIDVRPFPATSDDLPSTLASDRDRNAAAPWWRPIVAFVPYSLATIGRKVRRYLAFVGAHGVGALSRLEILRVN